MNYEKLRKIAVGLILTGGLTPSVLSWIIPLSTKSIFDCVASISIGLALLGLAIYAFAVWKL